MSQRTGATPSSDSTPPAPNTPASSTPTGDYGAPSLGPAVDRRAPAFSFGDFHADRAFGEGPTGGAA